MVRTKPGYLSTGRKTFTVKRYAPGVWTAGRYVKATPTDITIRANVQPLARSTLIRLNLGGDTTSAAYAIFSNDELRMQVEGQWEADMITIDGNTYELLEVIQYSMGVLDHWEAVGVRKELAS